MSALQTFAARAMVAIRSAWAWLGNNKEQLAILFALAAGATTLYQYLASVDDGRSKETLKYIDRSQEARVGQARAAIAKVLLAKQTREAYDRVLLAALETPPKLDGFEAFVETHELPPHLVVLIEHYMNLAGCVKAGVCDGALACGFYVSDIEALNNAFRPLFEQIWFKRDGQNYMAGPMAFVASCKQ